MKRIQYCVKCGSDKQIEYDVKEGDQVTKEYTIYGCEKCEIDLKAENFSWGHKVTGEEIISYTGILTEKLQDNSLYMFFVDDIGKDETT